jgi:hypothetical protein
LLLVEKRDKWNLSPPFSEELKVIVQTVHIVQTSINSRFIVSDNLGRSGTGPA